RPRAARGRAARVHHRHRSGPRSPRGHPRDRVQRLRHQRGAALSEGPRHRPGARAGPRGRPRPRGHPGARERRGRRRLPPVAPPRSPPPRAHPTPPSAPLAHGVPTDMSRSPHPESRPHVLIIDDEEDLCELLTLRLEHHGFRTSSEQTGRAGLEILEREVVDVIIVDLRLENENGLDLLTTVRQRSLDLPVIVLTAHGTIETAVEAMKRGAYGFLTKPFDDHELLQKLDHAVERGRLRRELAGLRRIVGQPSSDSRLLGTSTALAEV